MDTTVKMPIDLVQLPNFRQLRDLVGGVERALFVWWTLWQELGYPVQEGNAPGMMPASDRTMFLAALEPGEPDAGKREELLKHCLTARLLKVEGADLFCPRFAVLHGAVGGGGGSLAQLGGDMKAYHQGKRSVPAVAFQQSLLIQEAKMVDAEGKPLSRDEVKRVTRLVVSCDNALYRSDRPAYAYTEGLIQDALVVLKQFSDEEIDIVCDRLAKYRRHIAMSGMTTEKLLPQFREVLGKMGANQ